MYSLWANLSLLLGALILAGFLWFVLLVFCKFLFEDVVGGSVRKLRRKVEREKDPYVY